MMLTTATAKAKMARTPRNLERASLEHRLRIARQDAELLVKRLGINRAPVDPVAIAATERQHLRLCSGDYGNTCDGKLEYHPSKRRFVCFYNTKYDRGDGEHASRTRFSLAHELGHYFIEDHHQYLRSGGRSHASRSEFVASAPMEQQADCFAAHLLMPDSLVKPLVNQNGLSIELIAEVAGTFKTSFISAALRTAEVSHFCGAVAAIREGEIAWIRPSAPLIERRVYPGEKGPIRSKSAELAWGEYLGGAGKITERAGWARDWFRIYDTDLARRLPVTESYLPVRVMDTLIAVLSIPEDELCDDDEEVDEEDSR